MFVVGLSHWAWSSVETLIQIPSRFEIFVNFPQKYKSTKDQLMMIR